MSDSIIVALITCAVTLIGIFISAKSTRDGVTTELSKQNALQSAEIARIKEDIGEMKKDIKEHNSYGKRFLEMQGDIKVLDNRESVSEHRIDDLERNRA